LSSALNGRSANRGECAQCCRLPYTLIDADGQTIVADKHLLSLKDLNCSDDLEAMMEAGVSSFKIEGRLKEVSYVKNITAFYRKKLDALFAKNPRYYRSSAGTSSYSFDPQPAKSFNRGFSSYFLHGREPDIAAFDTPKSIGEQVGTVKELKGNSFTLAGLKPVHNGDGLVFFNARGELEGFRVNRAEANRIYPLNMPILRPKTPVYRNYDKMFEEQLSKPTAERKLELDLEFGDTPFGFALAVTDETGARAVIVRPFAKEPAKNDPVENIRTQLSKLGNTPFQVREIVVNMSVAWFVPSSVLGEMRRDAIERLLSVRRIRYQRLWVRKAVYSQPVPYPEKRLDYTANIANAQAADFYASHGVQTMEPAFEISPRNDVPLMYTKHCLRYSMGWCPVHHRQKSPYKEPFYLVHKQTRLRLQFDCKSCIQLIMND
jgi:putative protease